MIRTEQGRVVYRRKKHEWSYRDMVRIQEAFAKTATPRNLAAAIKETFRNFPAVFSLSFDDATSIVTDFADTLVEFVDGYAAILMMLKRKGPRATAIPSPPSGILEPLRGFAVRVLEKAINTIEEGGN